MTEAGPSEIVEAILVESRATKSALSLASGVSRSLIDDYLRGKREPTLRQLRRLAAGGGCQVEVRVRPRAVPAAFVAVLEFGEIFPRRPARPAVNAGPVWRAVREREARRRA